MMALIAIASGKSMATIAWLTINPALTAPGPPRRIGTSAPPTELTNMNTLPAKMPGAEGHNHIAVRPHRPRAEILAHLEHVTLNGLHSQKSGEHHERHK